MKKYIILIGGILVGRLLDEGENAFVKAKDKWYGYMQKLNDKYHIEEEFSSREEDDRE